MLTQVLFAVIPIAWLIIAMTLLKMSGVKACGIGLVITAAECLAVYKMGVPEVATGAAEGAIAALWPICIIIVAAMFTYNMSLHTGAMDIIKGMLGSVSNDKRIVALILGWGFSNFMEGIAGFGTAVAIPAAMMVGLGFDPISAAVICLIGNAASPAFGAIGTPTISAANTAGLDPNLLSEPTAFLLLILNLISPFIIIYLVGGKLESPEGSSAHYTCQRGFLLCSFLRGRTLCRSGAVGRSRLPGHPDLHYSDGQEFKREYSGGIPADETGRERHGCTRGGIIAGRCRKDERCRCLASLYPDSGFPAGRLQAGASGQFLPRSV